MIQGAINASILWGSTSALCHMDAGMEPSATNSLVIQELLCLSVLEEGSSLTQLGKALFTSSTTDSCLPSVRMWPLPPHVPGIRATTEMGPPDPLTKRTAGQEKQPLVLQHSGLVEAGVDTHFLPLAHPLMGLPPENTESPFVTDKAKLCQRPVTLECGRNEELDWYSRCSVSNL